MGLRLIDKLCEMISSRIEGFVVLEEQICPILPKDAEELEEYLVGIKS